MRIELEPTNFCRCAREVVLSPALTCPLSSQPPPQPDAFPTPLYSRSIPLGPLTPYSAEMETTKEDMISLSFDSRHRSEMTQMLS